MARLKNTFWNRNKYWLSAWVLVLPPLFFYQSMNPTFPDLMEQKSAGQFSASIMPLDNNAPYEHDGTYVKDYMVIFNSGEVTDIRQAYLNVGPTPLPWEQLQKSELGILHGSQYGQHVHAIAKPAFTAQDKLWLTIQNWQQQRTVLSWELASIP